MKKMVTIMLITTALLITTAFNSTIMAQQKTKEINIDIDINASIEDVWQVVGIEYADAYKWASGITHSKALNNISLNGSLCTERGCDVTGVGQITEKMLAYSDDEHLLSYEVTSGLPNFVSTAQNTWKLTTITGSKTHLEMRIKMQTKGFIGWLMGGIIKQKLQNRADRTLEELKYYVENGKAHPRTLKANAKAAKAHS